jgi:hypothetical protein
MHVVKAGALYFAVTFAAGFVLGFMRVVWVVPHVGERTAELLETPIMLGVIILAARWVAGRLALASTPTTRLGVGCVALGFLIVAEMTMGVWLRGLTIAQYFAGRDPVAGTVYIVMLGVFAIMPLLVART